MNRLIAGCIGGTDWRAVIMNGILQVWADHVLIWANRNDDFMSTSQFFSVGRVARWRPSLS